MLGNKGDSFRFHVFTTNENIANSFRGIGLLFDLHCILLSKTFRNLIMMMMMNASASHNNVNNLNSLIDVTRELLLIKCGNNDFL